MLKWKAYKNTTRGYYARTSLCSVVVQAVPPNGYGWAIAWLGDELALVAGLRPTLASAQKHAQHAINGIHYRWQLRRNLQNAHGIEPPNPRD